MSNNNIPLIQGNRRYNGRYGKTVILGGAAVNVISEYTPSWSHEYYDEFKTYDGKEVKGIKGVRFRLSFSTYGMSSAEVNTIAGVITAGEISLSCPEFSGMVYCDSFSAGLESANFYGEYFGGKLSLTAVDLIPVESGGGGGEEEEGDGL